MPLPRRVLFPLAAAAGAAGCTMATPAGFDARMRALLGRPESAVVAALGPPTFTVEDGAERRLRYDFASAAPQPGPTLIPPIGAGFGGGGWGGGFGLGVGAGLGPGLGRPRREAPPGCVLTFRVADGRVAGFERQGPGCVMAPPE
jgi:hypothetical protein